MPRHWPSSRSSEQRAVSSDHHSILQRLHAEATEFIVVGGMAMVSYGSDLIHLTELEEIRRRR